MRAYANRSIWVKYIMTRKQTINVIVAAANTIRIDDL
jgi:hypothetical protein